MIFVIKGILSYFFLYFCFTQEVTMEYNLENDVKYHYDKFPPTGIDFSAFIQELIGATEALARFDQMLKNLHNTEILLAPLRNQEAVISSRIEGTISRSEEHTSELQSRGHLVCRLLL